MLIGIIGTFDEVKIGGIRGNGKTATMSYILYKYYYKMGCPVYTNYKTYFSEFIPTDQLGSYLLKENDNNTNTITGVGIDEIQIFFDSYSKTSEGDAYFDDLTLIQQSRKKNIDIFFTIQRFMDLERRIRTQTDTILIPMKFDKDTGRQCVMDRCQKDHLFIVFSEDGRKVLKFETKDVKNIYNQFSVVK